MRHNAQWASWILEATYASFGCFTPSHLLSDLKSCYFCRGRTREGSVTGPGCCASCVALGPYDPTDPMVLEVYVAVGDAVWSLR